MCMTSWAIVGLMSGLICSKILDKQSDGFPLNISLGIVGAVVGGVLFDLFGASGATALNFRNIIVAMTSSRTSCC